VDNGPYIQATEHTCFANQQIGDSVS